MSKYLSISLVIVSLVTGMGLGYVLSPQYGNQPETAMTSDLGKPDKNTDLRFLDSMIEHHLGAIDMAQQVVYKTQRPEIRDLANRIIHQQATENNQLYEWKKSWYQETDQLKAENKVNLGEYDQKLDLRFLNAMIPHHEEAVEMAQEIKTKSTRNEILNLADQIIQAQSTEIDQMKAWRQQWYGTQ